MTWKSRAVLLVPFAVLIALGVMVFNQYFAPPPPPGSLEAQAQTWRDATEASSPLLSRVKAHVSSAGGYEHVTIDTTIADKEPLTYDLMKTVYDALLASTQGERKDEVIVVTFHYGYSESSQPRLLDVNKVFADAGFKYILPDGQTRGVTWESDSLVIIPDPALGGFPGTPGANRASESLLAACKMRAEPVNGAALPADRPVPQVTIFVAPAAADVAIAQSDPTDQLPLF
jgi:hypothetical protein